MRSVRQCCARRNVLATVRKRLRWRSGCRPISQSISREFLVAQVFKTLLGPLQTMCIDKKVQTGSGRLFQADGRTVAKYRRPSRCLGTCNIFFAEPNGDASGRTAGRSDHRDTELQRSTGIQ